jgi:S-(hydroxymethyl)mycothiol dehydrogenase
VKVLACGVCHTDLHYREGGINDDFPFLLGHEAAGTVEAVGPGVTEVAPGDYVILNWRAVCGQCRACAKGEPVLLATTTRQKALVDGTVLSPALGIGAFVEDAGRGGPVHQVSRDPARGRTAGLRGDGRLRCASARGVGGLVAVIGCGGVGSAAIAGAVLAGATTVIAVDVDDRKLAGALRFGATHTVNSREHDPVQAIQDLTGGHGADVVIDAVGLPETYRQAFYARDLAGTVVLVGVPRPGVTIKLPLLDVFGRGGALKSSWYGDCLPSRDFPMLIDLYRQGRFDLDAFVSETIGLGDVEEAFAKMHHGDVRAGGGA